MRVSAIWGAAFLIAGISGIFAGSDSHLAPVVAIVFRFLIPILCMGGATAYAQIQTRRHRQALATAS
jgi:hypothetical protein